MIRQQPVYSWDSSGIPVLLYPALIPRSVLAEEIIVQNTTDESLLYSAIMSSSLPDSYSYLLEISLLGTMDKAAGASAGNLTLRLYIDNDLLSQVVLSFPIGQAVANKGLFLYTLVTVRSVGYSGTCLGAMRLHELMTNSLLLDVPRSVHNINTTADSICRVTAQFSVAHANNVLRVQHGFCGRR